MTVSPGPEADDATLEVLLAALRAPDERTREDAARNLRDVVLGPAGEARWRVALREALRDSDATVRYYAAQGLGRVGDPALLDALGDPAMPVRREVVTLIGTLHDAERLAWVERAAAEVDLQLTPPELTLDTAVTVLRGTLADPSFEVREATLHALGDLGPRARAAVPQLLGTLEDDDVAVRALTADALGRIGLEARAAVPMLRRMARDEGLEDFAREAAAEAIAAITGDEPA